MIGKDQRNHEKFLTHLNQSEPVRHFIANWLRSRGHEVEEPEMETTPDYETRMTKADRGDIHIISKKPIMRIEVKGLSAHFTCRADWPFPDYIVCAVHAWDNAVPTPGAVIAVNAARTVAGIIIASSSARWTYRKILDRRYENVNQEFYIAQLNDVQFIDLRAPKGRERIKG